MSESVHPAGTTTTSAAAFRSANVRDVLHLPVAARTAKREPRPWLSAGLTERRSLVAKGVSGAASISSNAVSGVKNHPGEIRKSRRREAFVSVRSSPSGCLVKGRDDGGVPATPPCW